MKLPVTHIRAGAFGLVLICFFLPFVVVSCPQHGSASVSGVEIAFGRTIQGERLSSVTNDQRILPQVLAVLALACAVAGIIFSYLKKKAAFALCTAASAAGITLMIVLRTRMNAQAYILKGQGLVLRYEYGYSLALAAFILALVVTLALYPWSTKGLLSAARRRRR